MLLVEIQRGYRGYIGTMEKSMEASIVGWGYIGIMEKRMETTIYHLGAAVKICGGQRVALAA